ncbi:hypothetical protein PLEOSDRAFT_162398 [Pleurotus ostreatus PC15]|uniref:Uncharacterized protein n=1 Tax=Pleurotus ostreatus (strain PC15) TaxID=1137138 RepID=A0A067NHJ4_PLEO1|nr:hypothetical protein PLEOSDRAFT_162398 [Pleurotus ostreatus PC15]
MYFIPLVVASTALVALAANDWSQACFDGECAYDLREATGTSGIFKVHATPMGLTDITPAAGWVILECNPNVMDQEIRLVCETDHEDAASSASGCNHVFDYHGPAHKVVRLPENCGNGPFARIVEMTVAEDQTIPAHAELKIRRRDGAAPLIHTLKIDDNFAAIDAELCGTVQFAFVGATSPGLDLNSAFTDFFWDDVGKWVGDAVHTVGQAISTAKGWVAKAGNWVGDRMHDVSDLVKNRTSFEIAPKVESQDISLKSDVQFSSEEAHGPICPGGTHAKVDVHFKSDGSLKVKAGIVITGSVVPPAITKLAAFGGVDGSVDAALKATVQINGGFKYEKKIIEGLGLPGFSVPGVFTIGPYFELAGRVQGHIAIDLQTDIHLNYVFNAIEMWFPKEYGNHSKEGDVKTKDSNFGFQASAHLDAQGWLQATLAPQLHLGVWAAAGSVDASIYLEAAAYARASVHVEVSAKKREFLPPGRFLPAKPGHGGRVVSRKLNRRDVAFSGCAWLDLGVDLSGGATGKLGPLKADAILPIWSKNLQVLEKCWEAGKERSGKVALSKPTADLNKVDTNAQCSKEPSMSAPLTGNVKEQTLK